VIGGPLVAHDGRGVESVWVTAVDRVAARALSDRAGFAAAFREHARIDIKSFDDDPLPPRKRDRPTAIVLLLDRAALDHPRLSAWARACVRRTARDDDFRTFILLSGVGQREIGGSAPDQPLAVLQEGIQDTASSADGAKAAIVSFLGKVSDIRDASRRRRLRATIAACLGKLATAAQVCCAAVLAWRGLGEVEALRLRFLFDSSIVAFACGLTIAPIVALWLGIRRGTGTPWRIAATAVTALWVFVFRLAPLPTELPAILIAGVVAGVFTEIVRRAGVRESVSVIEVEPDLVTDRERLLDEMGTLVTACERLSPRATPISSGLEPRVFISYARGSQWGSTMAEHLHRELGACQIRAFFDQGIEEGANWRRTLSRMLTSANTIVFVVDAFTVRRSWPAAELAAALRAHARWGGPEIVVLKHPDLRGGDVEAGQPAFKCVLETCVGLRCPRVVVAGPNAIREQVAMLQKQFRLSKALLDRDEGRIVQQLTFPFQVVGVRLSSLSTVPGVLAVALLAMDVLPVEGDWAGSIDNAVARQALGCVAAYWAGSVIRLTSASRFDFADQYRLRTYWSHAVMAVSFSWVAVRLLAPLDTVAWVWGAIACCAGWLMADVFVYNVLKQRPGLVRNLPE
jgi:hypothetical protein